MFKRLTNQCNYFTLTAVPLVCTHSTTAQTKMKENNNSFHLPYSKLNIIFYLHISDWLHFTAHELFRFDGINISTRVSININVDKQLIKC